jgi:D-alanyl-D-alanine carboxypeptidase
MSWLSEALHTLFPPKPGAATPAPMPTGPNMPVPSAPGRTVLMQQSWPKQSQCSIFYGDPHSASFTNRLVVVHPPWALNANRSYGATYILIHQRCAPSLKRVLQWTWEECNQSQQTVERLRYDRFSGSYNDRSIRGGRAISMHGYGVAIDWDDDDNQMNTAHPLFTRSSPLIKAFLAEGWEWGGDWTSPKDYMHVQAAHVR